MKKYLIISAFVLLLAVGAYLAWKHILKAKTAGAITTDASGTLDTKPLPPAPPVSTAGGAPPPAMLYGTDTGAGGAAVKARMLEVQGNGPAMAEIRLSIQSDKTMRNGVPSGVADFTATQVSMSTGGAGFTNIPVPLTATGREAVEGMTALKYVSGATDYWPTLHQITQALTRVRTATGVAFLKDSMYSQNMNFIRNEFLVPYLSGNLDEKRMRTGAETMVNGLVQLAKNWLALSELAEKAVKEKAVQDLRASGWKFIGYDQPA